MSTVERKLTTILAADVVGFSRLMGDNEEATLATLKACRAIIDGSIAEHNGRIFGGAGDSVIAEFASPVQAVLCAAEFQRLLADRNSHFGDREPMLFRVGVNMGDVIIDGGNLYGDGVNVAARIEALAEPGGVCVSRKIHEEVRRKLDLLFVDGGEQQLKNIADPVAIFHMRKAGASGAAGGEKSSAAAPIAARTETATARPTVAVLAIKASSGGDEIQSLAEGLREGIVGSLAKQTALSVLDSAPGSGPGANFRLEGSVRAAGQKLRLTFALIDTASQSQVWSERYDRQLDDTFDLEDEISKNVASAVRLRIKASAFEKLRQADNATLGVPELLSKAAGYFLLSPTHNAEPIEALRLAMEQAPDNSMAVGMMAFCQYRGFELTVMDIPPEVRQALIAETVRAVSLDPSSYAARLFAALVAQDIRGDYQAALRQTETALELNSGFSGAQAMLGIVTCHLGEIERGLEILQRQITSDAKDPHRFRHLRELAIAQFLAGRHDQAVETVSRLIHLAPELARNRLALASLSWHAGNHAAAKECVEGLRRDYPDLNLRTMRPARFADATLLERYLHGLAEAGLPA
jgi:adenylate cyclase